MARVKLIVTGDLEKLALHRALERVFGGRRINSQGEEEEVVWDKPRKLHGATSHRLLMPGSGASVSGPMRDLACAMLQEAGIGVTSDPADLVVVIDDVELGNVDQVPVVVEHFRRATRDQLHRFELRTRERYTDEIQRRCSFHLFMPMVEAYFYAHPEAMFGAGVAPTVHWLLQDLDVELFEVIDPSFLSICSIENARRQRVSPWWRHERHPKHYLEHLIARTGDIYEETSHGKDGLLALDWRCVPTSTLATPVIRALFQDLADFMGVPNPLGAGLCHPALCPEISVRREHLLLRNL